MLKGDKPPSHPTPLPPKTHRSRGRRQSERTTVGGRALIAPLPKARLPHPTRGRPTPPSLGKAYVLSRTSPLALDPSQQRLAHTAPDTVTPTPRNTADPRQCQSARPPEAKKQRQPPPAPTTDMCDPGKPNHPVITCHNGLLGRKSRTSQTTHPRCEHGERRRSRRRGPAPQHRQENPQSGRPHHGTPAAGMVPT